MPDPQPVSTPIPESAPPLVPPPPPPAVKPVFPTYREDAPTPTGSPSSGRLRSIFVFLIFGVLVIGLLFLLVQGAKNLLGTKAPFGIGQKTLIYWGLWEPESVMQPIIDKYQKSHPSIKVQYVRQSPQDYRERLTNSLAEGKGPDIFRFHNTWTPMLARDLAPVPPKVFDAETFQKTFYPVAKKDLIVANKILGLPLGYDGLALYYNTDIFQAKGKQPPQDWNDLRKIALDITNSERDELGRIKVAGVALGTTSNVDHWQDILSLMMLQNDVDPTNLTDKTAQDALTFYTIFNTTDHVWDETLPNSTTAFIQGKLAMYFGPSWRIFDFEEAKKSQNPNLHYGVLPVPQLPETNTTWASYWVEGVGKNSKNLEDAWDFLKYLTQSETLQALFQAESQLRSFGELYGRQDMADLLKNNPLTNAYIIQAPTAKSWYLASRTGDGPTGINSRVSKYFEDAVNGMVQGNQDAASVLKTASAGITQVLLDYKIISAPAQSQ